jgi:hypothetical protein
MKKCSNCGVEKNDDCFYPKENQCKKCKSDKRKQYLQKLGEVGQKQRAEYFRTYWQQHPDDIRANNRKYKKSKKAKITAKNLRKNPAIKLRQNISTNIGYHLRVKNSSKYNKSILQALPYTIQELKKYIEQQFEPWMTWENYGLYDAKTWKDDDQSTWTWQLDHIIPHSTFDYTSMEDQSFKDCWAFNNLRPLSAKQNLLDGVKRIRHGGLNV